MRILNHSTSEGGDSFVCLMFFLLFPWLLVHFNSNYFVKSSLVYNFLSLGEQFQTDKKNKSHLKALDNSQT